MVNDYRLLFGLPSDKGEKPVDPQETAQPQREHSGNKYLRRIYANSGSAFIIVDVYCVIEAYGVTCPALQHAIKKILAPGQRGKADRQQDIQEAIDALLRALVLQEQRVWRSDE